MARAEATKQIRTPSFRGDAKHRTRNLEIPGLALTRHPGMTESELSVASLSQRPSYSAKAEYPVRRALSIPSPPLWNTGSPAFAGDDGWGCGAVVFNELLRIQFSNSSRCWQTQLRRHSFANATSRSRGAMRPRFAFISRPQGGRGECRVPAAPAVSCALGSGRTHTSNNEYTGIARHSRTQWFYGLCRALPGDRALLPPSSADMFCLSPVGPT